MTGASIASRDTCPCASGVTIASGLTGFGSVSGLSGVSSTGVRGDMRASDIARVRVSGACSVSPVSGMTRVSDLGGRHLHGRQQRERTRDEHPSGIGGDVRVSGACDTSRVSGMRAPRSVKGDRMTSGTRASASA